MNADLYATLAGAGMMGLLTGGETRSSGFVRRMMAENMVKHKGKYGKPSDPNAPNSTMSANRGFSFSKIHKPSKFINRYFGPDATGTHEYKRKSGKPAPYTEPFKKNKGTAQPVQVVERIVYRDRPVNRPALNTLTQRELGSLWKEYGLASYSTKSKAQLIEGLEARTNYPEPGLKGTTPAVATTPAVTEGPRLVIQEPTTPPTTTPARDVITHFGEPRNEIILPKESESEASSSESESESESESDKEEAPKAKPVPKGKKETAAERDAREDKEAVEYIDERMKSESMKEELRDFAKQPSSKGLSPFGFFEAWMSEKHYSVDEQGNHRWTKFLEEFGLGKDLIKRTGGIPNVYQYENTKKIIHAAQAWLTAHYDEFIKPIKPEVFEKLMPELEKKYGKGGKEAVEIPLRANEQKHLDYYIYQAKRTEHHSIKSHGFERIRKLEFMLPEGTSIVPAILKSLESVKRYEESKRRYGEDSDWAFDGLDMRGMIYIIKKVGKVD